MFRDQRRYGNDPETVVRAARPTFDSPLKWDEPERVFTCSWSDWFHVDADTWRDEAWEIIRRCPQHTFLILTKRVGRVVRHLPADWGDGWPNVWLGVSVESAAFLHRIRVLRGIPAALRFVSAEPLLGSLQDLALPQVPSSGARGERDAVPPGHRVPLDLSGIDWVIAGGESGSRKDARPMHPDWVREIRDTVVGTHTGMTSPCPAFHFKQWGSWTPDEFGSRDRDGVYVAPDGRAETSLSMDALGLGSEMNGAVRMGYAGPTPDAGGKVLDGRTWCEIPGVFPDSLTLA